jgi:hypothetical protein
MVAKPNVTHDLVVAMDYGQFLLCGGNLALSDPMALLSEALEGDGIAGDGQTVIVRSPHQNNFAMALRVEVWSDRPPDDLDEWQEAFEATLTVAGSGQLVYNSPTLSTVVCPMPAGQYEMLLTGRGIVARGWPGSTEPGDSWRLRLWPAHGEIVARRLRSWDPDWPGPAPIRPAPMIKDPAQWTNRLKQELLAHLPDAACCRRAEAAALIGFDAAATTDQNPMLPSSTLGRLQALLGDEIDDPNLMTKLGLVSINGRTVRGLRMIAPQHCVVATWRGAFLAAGELVAKGRTLRLTVAAPTIERALALSAMGRRLGLAAPAHDGPPIVVLEGPQALEVLGATETLAAWVA